VFNGLKGSAYVDDHRPAPLSAHGRPKLAGEIAALAE
jgi:dTDP-4-dehydrorhamnose reductase